MENETDFDRLSSEDLIALEELQLPYRKPKTPELNEYKTYTDNEGIFYTYCVCCDKESLYSAFCVHCGRKNVKFKPYNFCNICGITFHGLYCEICGKKFVIEVKKNDE